MKLNPSFYRKAVLAFLAGALAYAQGTQPNSLGDWGKVAVAGLSAGALAYFVPNKEAKPKVGRIP